MKHAERESFLKSFFVFFISLAFLATILSFLEYRKQKQERESEIFHQMKICSLDLKCKQFEFDFVPIDSQNLYKLSNDQRGLFSLFALPQDSQYALKLTLSQKSYEEEIGKVQHDIIVYYFVSLVIIGLLSIVFSLYTLYPLKKALQLTEEFSRDILHDLHTPLSTLRLNVERLQGRANEEKKIDRIKQSVETIISLSENLKSYLEGHPSQVEVFDLYAVLIKRVEVFQKIYPHIEFSVEKIDLMLGVNYDAFVRVIDNLLNNAGKYNTFEGRVIIDIDLQQRILFIRDSGKGILHPEKVFERFYKEHDRGLGIGLHIVKKLCDEMGIGIKIESQIGEGTDVILDLSKVIRVDKN